MNFFYKLINHVYIYTQKLGICGNTGLIAGITTGLILCFYNLRLGGLAVFNSTEAWQVGLLLTLFCWLEVMFLIVLFLRLRLSSIIVPTFFNCLLVCMLTVFVVSKLNLFFIAWLIGLLIGIMVGYVLCQFSKSLHFNR